MRSRFCSIVLVCGSLFLMCKKTTKTGTSTTTEAAESQPWIAGRVFNIAAEKPVKDATVTASYDNFLEQSVTDTSGRFRLRFRNPDIFNTMLVELKMPDNPSKDWMFSRKTRFYSFPDSNLVFDCYPLVPYFAYFVQPKGAMSLSSKSKVSSLTTDHLPTVSATHSVLLAFGITNTVSGWGGYKEIVPFSAVQDTIYD